MVNLVETGYAFLSGNFSFSEAMTLAQPLAIFIIGMVIYSIFIFKFYRFVARKDIFKIKHSKRSRVVTFLTYVFDYLIIFPIVVFFWFAILGLLLSFLAKTQSVEGILLVCISVVSAIRITAYYDEDLSRDLAKLLPFALLGVFIVDLNYFSVETSISLINQIPVLWKVLAYYMMFVIILELILRIISSALGSLFGTKKKE